MTVVRAGASLAYTELVLKCTKIKANVGQSSRALARVGTQGRRKVLNPRGGVSSTVLSIVSTNPKYGEGGSAPHPQPGSYGPRTIELQLVGMAAASVIIRRFRPHLKPPCLSH